MVLRPRLLAIPLWFFLVSIAITCCRAVLIGDEQFAEKDGGRFWAFHSAGVSVVNADTCRVEHTFRNDPTGLALPDSWADGVYMEHTTSNGEGYVLINSGVTSYDEDDQPMGEVIIFSTNPKLYEGRGPVESRVPIEGGRHHSSYGIYTRNEYWTEADSNLFIIHLDDLEKFKIVGKGHLPTKIGLQAEVTQLGQGDSDGIRGQMLWDESRHLARHGYVTSRQKAIYIVDLETKAQVGIFNYSSFLDEGECSRGTHGIAFSEHNNHLFVECTWQGPTLELDLDIPTEPQFVAKHNISGWLQEDSIYGLVVATDRARNQLHIFEPGTKGLASSTPFQVEIPGRPDMPSFFRKSSFETVVCMALTENANRNNMDSNGNVACDQFSCGPPQTPKDVAAGMCLYDETTNNMELLRVRLDDFEKVVNEEVPYNNSCPRCKNRDSYRGGDICTCTPHCGSCADPDYDATWTGVRCFHLESILGGDNVESTLIEGAGAIEQRGPSFWQPQCSFGWTHRSSKRGGRYHVSVAHFPSNSVQVVDMYSQLLKCQVDLPGRPDRVLYVPPQPHQVLSYEVSERQTFTRAGSITLLVMGIIAAVVLILLVLQYATRTSSSSTNWDTDACWEPSDDLELTPRETEQEALPAIS